MKPISVLCSLAVAAVGWSQAAAPVPNQSQVGASDQQPVTTLKVSTRVVAISAVVKSKEGTPVGGLAKDDFVLKQDGREEPIRYFSQGSELPLTFAVMVDTSGSQRTFVGDESLASDVFFETMLGRKEDRAMLVQFDTGILRLTGMTNSAEALHLALLRLNTHVISGAGTLLNDAVYDIAKNVLADETGRKAMVILTDGGDNGSHRSLTEAIEQAQRGNVQIYSILYSASDALSGLYSGHPVAPNPGLDILKRMAESTGGHVFTVSRSLSLREIFAQIGQDLRLQYELGYTPPPDVQPGSYHRLELKMRDKRLTVQARKGFFAPP